MDAEAGDEYDSYLMYSNEVLKSPTSSKTPSVSGDGGYPETKNHTTTDDTIMHRNPFWKPPDQKSRALSLPTIIMSNSSGIKL